MKKIRLLLIEDNRLLREGITSFIKESSDIRMATAPRTDENISQKIQNFKPTVVLLDLGVRSQNNLHLVKTVRNASSATKIIVMGLIPTQGDILDFVRAGVSGFILKDATNGDFLKTIRSVAQGAKVLPSKLTGSLFSGIAELTVSRAKESSSILMESVRMTRRERQVMELIYKGMTNKEIAEQLHLSTYTVKSHVHNILEKLALHTRVQIAKYVHTSERSQEKANTITE